jgi:prepilin-type N-terminal cleavage/methylation domain-containing protein
MKATSLQRTRAFTLVELLTVISVIVVLAAILLNVLGYANNRACRSRALAEIHLIAAACESYKADNGQYPMPYIVTGSPMADYDASAPGGSKPPSSYNETDYQMALYEGLTGDGNDVLSNMTGKGQGGGIGNQGKNYMTVVSLSSSLFGTGSIQKPNQPPPPPGMQPISWTIGEFKDPWGVAYYYAPSGVVPSGMPAGYSVHNAGGVDLFSTAASGTSAGWVGNW